jgi:formylglycine-generating enzyme required for sulfatase activity
MMNRLFMFLVSVLMISIISSCGTNPGRVSIAFTWKGGNPPDGLWIFGRVIQVNSESETNGQIISEMEAPQEYGPGMNLAFPDIQNQDNLAILLEARGDGSLESRVLYYGISKPFSLMAGNSVTVDVVVSMDETPGISSFVIDEAVGPEKCPDCYSSNQKVTLKIKGNGATAVEVANDNDFSVCRYRFEMNDLRGDLPRLTSDAEGWAVEGWELDCGLDDAVDGPRNVYARLLDDMGYPSQVLSAQIILDREPPQQGVLSCADGQWLIKLETTMLFGVLKADEMWLEASEIGSGPQEEWVSVPAGIEPCSPDHENYIAVDHWIPVTTQGCIRFADDTISAVRVKYRDFARNETSWVVFEFANIADLKLTWVAIPGGTFTMGCSPKDTECLSDEVPAHEVTLSPFEMAETEVTEDQFRAATGETPSCNFATDGGDLFPVECVTWDQARDFCEIVGGRLPTEAEWEYAARGGTKTMYYCGNNENCLHDIAWYNENSGNHKHEVGGKNPNAFGLYDMLGNVYEWTADWYDSQYYQDSPVHSPKGPHTGISRVGRGGGCAFYYAFVRVSQRSSVGPAYTGDDLGFRCVR